VSHRVRDRFQFQPAQPAAGARASSWVLATPENALLALLLVVELWVFSGAFHKFFTHDSLFYMTHVPRTWAQFKAYLVAPSDEKSYRPLNLGFIALVRPFFGVDPYPYHWIPIAFHVVNTLLFFLLARRILTSSTAVLAATAFWGLHSVAGWITYDITYLSDFLLAFLFLLTLLLAVEGHRRKKWPWTAASICVYLLSLLTKEAATTFPLAVWIALALADLRALEAPVTRARAWTAFKKTLPLTCVYLALAIAFAGLFVHWLHAGLIYTQGANAAYNINLSSNLLAKSRYVYWAFNLPDALVIHYGEEIRALVFVLMGSILLAWLFDLLRREGGLSAVEWSGLIWFVGLNVPALLLSSRLAKWYLYLPLMGLALAFGVVVENLRASMPAKVRSYAGPAISGLLIGILGFAASVQTRSYVAASDSEYQSDLLQSCLTDFRQAHPTLPPRVTLYFLPAFEEGVSDLLSAPPIDGGQLFELYYPASRVQAMFVHKGARIPADIGSRSDTYVLQYLDHHLYEVTDHFKNSGLMTLYVLPTPEGKAPPLLKKEPAGGNKIFRENVKLSFADEGARLPEDYLTRPDIWILQYLEGHFNDVTRLYINGGRQTMVLLPTIDGKIPPLHLLEENPAIAPRLSQSHMLFLSYDELVRLPGDYFARLDLWVVQYMCGRYTDVTDYYKGRRRQDSQRVVHGLEGIQSSVNRAEFYPDYSQFATPSGTPVFFPTPEKEILTQIGGSTLVIPLHKIPDGSRLRFDVSWMFDQGDGGWAEAAMRTQGKESVIFREYMRLSPKEKSHSWKEVAVDLQAYWNEEADLILKCYNDPGKKTVADWLNWRDIVLEPNPRTQR
jgi:hypothetical protein